MAIIKIAERLTGTSMPEGEFRVHETHQSVDVTRVFEVLRGNLAAYQVTGFVPVNDCRRIVESFWASAHRVSRYGDGEGGVEGYLVGASHIEKTTAEYLQEAAAFESAMENLYGGVSPVSTFRALLAAGNDAVQVRPARSGRLTAGDSKAACWNGTGSYLLQPHDDFAQLRDPRQEGFEIQRATRVMAVNVYAEVPIDSGGLQLWNVEPDERSRARLGLSYSGFPYPPELLKEFRSIVIPVVTGDLCVVNGNLVHAVLRGDSALLAKRRLLLTCFMALIEDDLIWWT